MLSGVQFGPRIECIDEVRVSPKCSENVEPERVKKRNKDGKGRFTIFDDDPVAITPSHPLAQDKIRNNELSEIWTRKNEDLDWDNLINSESVKTRQKMNKHDVLEDLISLKLTKSWNVDVDTETTSNAKRSKSQFGEYSADESRESITNTGCLFTDGSYQPSHTEGTAQSTTGLEDSRTTFPLHDLTGVVKTKEREEELMKYMGLNNLDFNIAKKYAPKDEEKSAFGVIEDGVFHAFPKEKSSSKTTVQERLVPDPRKTKNAAREQQNEHTISMETEKLCNQTKQLGPLIRLLCKSKADLMCATMDSHATFESAERMEKEANDWFLEELNKLEKVIKDEKNLGNKFTRHLNRSVQQIISKICDLEVIYETLDFLENKLKVAEKTIALSQENMRNARKILAKLTVTDYKQTTPRTTSSTLDSILAANTATAFFKFEQILLKIAPFTARSSLASSLVDSVTDQMRGIRKAVVEEVPRRLLSEYNSRISRNSPEIRNFPPVLAEKTKTPISYELFKKPRKKKFCSYIKLDPWPTETYSYDADPDTISSSTILSVESNTLPLSDYHESARSGTPSKSSFQDSDLYAAFDAKKRSSCDDRPPTAIGSRVYSLSETSVCPTFEEAVIIPNSCMYNKNMRRQKSSSASSSVTNPSAFSIPTGAASRTFTSTSASDSRATRSSDLKTARLAALSAKTAHSKMSGKSAIRRTPDPVRLHFRRNRTRGPLESWDDVQGRREMIVNNQEYLEKHPFESSSVVTANTQFSDHAIQQNLQ